MIPEVNQVFEVFTKSPKGIPTPSFILGFRCGTTLKNCLSSFGNNVFWSEKSFSTFFSLKFCPNYVQSQLGYSQASLARRHACGYSVSPYGNIFKINPRCSHCSNLRAIFYAEKVVSILDLVFTVLTSFTS